MIRFKIESQNLKAETPSDQNFPWRWPPPFERIIRPTIRPRVRHTMVPKGIKGLLTNNPMNNDMPWLDESAIFIDH
jgi:hypothetical protein